MIGAGVPATPSRVRDGDGGEYEMEETGVKLPAGARTMEIVGNCMEPLLHEGDVVFVRPASGASSGDIVIALVDLSGITCKVYRVDEAGRSYLEPFAGSGHFSETGDTPRPGEGRIPHDRFSIAGVVMGYFRPIGGAR
ncbi:MAG TPA: S24 family peptidase [Fibrella sp.]